MTTHVPTPDLPLAPHAGWAHSLASYLLPTYILMVAAGFVLLSAPEAVVRGNELSKSQTLFIATNAATLTGFQTSRPFDAFRPFGQATLFTLTAGGTLLTTIIGGLAVTRLARLRFTDSQIVLGSILFFALLPLPVALLCLSQTQSFPAAWFNAISAYANSGLFSAYTPRPSQWQTHVLLLPLATLGGLGVPVLLDLFDWIARRTKSVSAYTQTFLISTAGIYLLFVVLSLITRLAHSIPQDLADFRTLLATTSASVLNSRTVGFPMDLSSPRPVRWLHAILFTLGAAPAGTAGGLTLAVPILFYHQSRQILAGKPASQFMVLAITWLGTFTLIACVTFLILLTTDPQLPADRALFDSLSALTNAGLSTDAITLSPAGTYTLSLTMLVGRLMPLGLLWWLLLPAPATRR